VDRELCQIKIPGSQLSAGRIEPDEQIGGELVVIGRPLNDTNRRVDDSLDASEVAQDGFLISGLEVFIPLDGVQPLCDVETLAQDVGNRNAPWV
jgi:hypothetical protein